MSRALNLLYLVKNTPSYRDIIQLSIESAFKFIEQPIESIQIVSNQYFDIKLPIGKTTPITWYSDYDFENLILQHEGIKRKAAPEPFNNTWVKQQIFKLYSDLIKPVGPTLVIDADLVFLKPITFFNGPKQIFYTENEHYVPYFRTLKNLLGIDKQMEQSFIADHMLFFPALLKQMRQASVDLNKKSFLIKLHEELMSSKHEWIAPFSEYETYGSFLLNKFSKNTFEFVHNPKGQCWHLAVDPKKLPTLEQIVNTIPYDHYFIPLNPDPAQERSHIYLPDPMVSQNFAQPSAT